MAFKKGRERNQMTLLPETLDDYVEAGSYVRYLEDFIDGFDLVELGFKHSTPSETGRPPYDPADLLKLYLYGSMNRLNSSRRLAAACKNNIEVMWLLRRLKPDFRTISDFRKDNRKAIRRLFKKFIKDLREIGIVDGELVGVDGSKFSASNSKDNNYSEKKLKRLILYYERRMKGYLTRLDKNDHTEEESPEIREQLQLQLEVARKRQKEKQELLQRLQSSKQKQISIVDPDSKRMKSGDGTIVGYNVQAVVDSKHKLIIDVEATNNGNDLHELEKMATRAQEILEKENIKVAADTGYYRAEEIANCEKKGIETYVSKPQQRESQYFSKKDFIYFKEENYYLCPAGQKLEYKGKVREHGRLLLYYQTKACKNCFLRQQCTSRKYGNRRITRFLDEDLLEAVDKRVTKNPQIRTIRKSLVEHVFGSLKNQINGRLLTRGLARVETEVVLATVAYDLKRLFNITQSPFRPKTPPGRSPIATIGSKLSKLFSKPATLIDKIVYQPKKWGVQPAAAV